MGTASSILTGGLVGVLAAFMHNFYDAFQNTEPDSQLFVQLATRVVIYVLAGALVLGVVSAIRNRLIQHR